jgi:putative transposase
MSYSPVLFYPATCYHVYHQGNAGESIFKSDENFNYFLRKYSEYILPIAETYAYCLMPNHFHFAIMLREEEAIRKFLSTRFMELHPNKIPPALKTPEELAKAISKQFGDFLNGYSQAFNKWHRRKGRLFSESLQRKIVDNLFYFRNLIQYIHWNPVHHGFSKTAVEWLYSSIHSYISSMETKIEREKGLALFDGLNGFKDCHRRSPDQKLFLALEY